MADCQRCNRPDSATRYRVVKPGLAHERDLCDGCAEFTAATYGLEPIGAVEAEAPAESPAEETAILEVNPDPDRGTIEETEAAPEVASEPKPARKPRGTRRRKS